MIDRAGLAEFLRVRREALQPEDVGLPRGRARRTERAAPRGGRGAVPHVDRLLLPPRAGARPAAVRADDRRRSRRGCTCRSTSATTCSASPGTTRPRRGAASDHISPGLLRILDRLERHPRRDRHRARRDAAADPARRRAHRRHAPGSPGPARSIGYRWFTDPAPARSTPPEDHDVPLAAVRLGAARGRRRCAGPAPGRRTSPTCCSPRSEEFRGLWDAHEVGVRPAETKRFVHPEVGPAGADAARRCVDPEQSHPLLVYTAVPGSESHEKLRLLSVIGAQAMR